MLMYWQEEELFQSLSKAIKELEDILTPDKVCNKLA